MYLLNIYLFNIINSLIKIHTSHSNDCLLALIISLKTCLQYTQNNNKKKAVPTVPCLPNVVLIFCQNIIIIKALNFFFLINESITTITIIFHLPNF